jgi:hypothetical protein
MEARLVGEISGGATTIRLALTCWCRMQPPPFKTITAGLEEGA